MFERETNTFKLEFPPFVVQPSINIIRVFKTNKLTHCWVLEDPIQVLLKNRDCRLEHTYVLDAQIDIQSIKHKES